MILVHVIFYIQVETRALRVSYYVGRAIFKFLILLFSTNPPSFSVATILLTNLDKSAARFQLLISVRRSRHSVLPTSSAMEASTTPRWLSMIRACLAAESSPATSRFLQLGTVGLDGRPAVRTVVFRGWHATSLLAVTDTRSSKIPELRALPYAELCWYFQVTSVLDPVHKVLYTWTEILK